MIHYLPNSSVTHGMGDLYKPFAIQMATVMGFQFSGMILALLTIMLGSGAIASEMESGLIQGILSRPIPRHHYILGKLFGLIILACSFATVIFMLMLAIGGLFGLETITSLTFFQTIGGWLLYMWIPVTVLCLTVFGSVSLKAVPNGILMIFIYILGNVGGTIEMIGHYMNSDSIISTGIFISLVSPFQVIYNAMEQLMFPASELAGTVMAGSSMSGSGEPASVWMYLYIVLYMLTFVWLAVRKFSRKDIS